MAILHRLLHSLYAQFSTAGFAIKTIMILHFFSFSSSVLIISSKHRMRKRKRKQFISKRISSQSNLFISFDTTNDRFAEELRWSDKQIEIKTDETFKWSDCQGCCHWTLWSPRWFPIHGKYEMNDILRVCAKCGQIHCLRPSSDDGTPNPSIVSIVSTALIKFLTIAPTENTN